VHEFLQLAALSFLLYLPFQHTVAQEDLNANFSYAGEAWTIQELPVSGANIPPSTDSYATFNIIKSGEKWLVGGTLKNPSAELLYVDQKTKTLGPINYLADTGVLCSAKAEERENLSKIGQYNSCRSEFYTSDKVSKVAQATVACLLFGCLFGYDSDWFPVFRPKLLKQALGLSDLMTSFAEHFRNKELLAIRQHAAILKDATSGILKRLNSINYNTKNIASTKAGTALLQELSENHRRNLQDFQKKTRSDFSLPFDLDRSQIQNEREKILPYSQSTKDRIQEIERLLTANLNKLEQLREIELATVREIQNLLNEHRYSALTADGLIGPSTANALANFYSDINVPIERGDKQKILATIKSALIDPVETCPGIASDLSYTICFNFSQ